MQLEYLARLSKDIRANVESIEKHSGVEIVVQIDSSRKQNRPDFPDSLACQVDEYGAQLLIPSQEHFHEASVLHELLHVRRFLVDCTPRIVICDEHDDWSPSQESGLTRLDNQLEHFVIVPEELKKRPDRVAYWKSGVERALKSLVRGNLIGADFIQVLLMNWVFLNLVIKDEDLAQIANDLIRQGNLGDTASKLLEAVASSLESKESLVWMIFHFLELSMEGVCLQVIDTNRGTVMESKLSDVEIG